MNKPTHPVFRPIRNHLHHEAVIDQITFAIRTGRYAPGDKLPSLEELRGLMGVSKPVITAAVRTLSVAGIIIAQRGNSGGLRVVTNNIPAALLGLSTDGFSVRIDAILEARRSIEMELNLRCAERANQDDFAEMEQSISLFSENKTGDPAERRHYDHLFHYCVGRAARSEMLAYYQHQILERLSILVDDYFENEESPDMVEELHRKNLAALRSGKRQKVIQAVDRHLAPLEAEFVDQQTTKGA